MQALKVNNQAVPDTEDPLLQIPATGFLINPTINGIDGDFDARVNGSLTSPIDFSITADADSDIFLQALGFLVAGQGATLSDFGGVPEGNNNTPPIPNGCQLISVSYTHLTLPTICSV